jgi:hypothetical protein
MQHVAVLLTLLFRSGRQCRAYLNVFDVCVTPAGAMRLGMLLCQPGIAAKHYSMVNLLHPIMARSWTVCYVRPSLTKNSLCFLSWPRIRYLSAPFAVVQGIVWPTAAIDAISCTIVSL